MAQKYVVLFLVYMISYSAQSQEKIKMNADSIIDNFIEIIGGDKWKNLESRIEKGFVENHRDQASNNPIPQTSTRTTYYKAPHYFLEYKDSFFQGKLVLTYQPECNWYYSQKVPLLYFFGPDPIKFESKFPRTELLEAFNLKAKEQVYIVDSLVRVDFLDKRRKDGVLSLFFSMETGLLKKRMSVDQSSTKWEHQFKDYREKDGLKEPYIIELIGGGEPFQTIQIDAISYNENVDSDMFDPPMPCKNFPSREVMENPYFPAFMLDE